MSTFQLLYPERRHVSVAWVLTQGFDAKVNAAVDEHVRQHGVFAEDGSYEAFVAGIPAPDLDECIELLSDLGLATFSRQRDADSDGFDYREEGDDDGAADGLRCRYEDCHEGHPVAHNGEQITCPTCRAYLGLPEYPDRRHRS